VTRVKRRNLEATELSLLEAVFEGRTRPARGSRWLGGAATWSIALALHGFVLLFAGRTQPSLETWSARLGALIHADLVRQAPVAIETPAPVEPPPVAPPPAAEDRPAPAERGAARALVARLPAAANSGNPAPPAQAGSIVAAADEPSRPLDLTGDTFVSGTASAYVGGATAHGGTNHAAVPADAVDPRARPTSWPGSQARPVGLPADEWQCAWPAAALEADVYEKYVLLRVVVRDDGSVEQAQTLADPGQGFGAAAISCARRTRFTPARDAAGHAIRAASPPIRVRFTR
jgi:protein TonB